MYMQIGSLHALVMGRPRRVDVGIMGRFLLWVKHFLGHIETCGSNYSDYPSSWNGKNCLVKLSNFIQLSELFKYLLEECSTDS